MDDIYKNIEEYNLNKNLKIDMIGDMLSNKRFNPIVTELFAKGRKLFLLFLLHNRILLLPKIFN